MAHDDPVANTAANTAASGPESTPVYEFQLRRESHLNPALVILQASLQLDAQSIVATARREDERGASDRGEVPDPRRLDCEYRGEADGTVHLAVWGTSLELVEEAASRLAAHAGLAACGSAEVEEVGEI